MLLGTDESLDDGVGDLGESRLWLLGLLDLDLGHLEAKLLGGLDLLLHALPLAEHLLLRLELLGSRRQNHHLGLGDDRLLDHQRFAVVHQHGSVARAAGARRWRRSAVSGVLLVIVVCGCIVTLGRGAVADSHHALCSGERGIDRRLASRRSRGRRAGVVRAAQ